MEIPQNDTMDEIRKVGRDKFMQISFAQQLSSRSTTAKRCIRMLAGMRSSMSSSSNATKVSLVTSRLTLPERQATTIGLKLAMTTRPLSKN